MLSILLPIYARQLGASATAIGGLFSVFTGVLLVVRPLTGWALDHYGRRPLLLLALTSYVACMLVEVLTYRTYTRGAYSTASVPPSCG